jgi:hypothetical protein
MLFDDPELNLRAEYTLFDRQTGRPVCIGDGETCQRRTSNGVEQHPCPSPDLCPLAQGGQCKPYARLYVNLDEQDELGSFVLRTTGFNSIRTLTARLRYYHAAVNGLLSCLPLQLTLRGKSTSQSYGTPIYYVDLTLREGVSLQHAIIEAKQLQQEAQACGFQQELLDQVARQGYANAVFDRDEGEEGIDVVDEFYPEHLNEASSIDQQQNIPEIQQIQQGLQQSVRVVN